MGLVFLTESLRLIKSIVASKTFLFLLFFLSFFYFFFSFCWMWIWCLYNQNFVYFVIWYVYMETNMKISAKGGERYQVQVWSYGSYLSIFITYLVGISTVVHYDYTVIRADECVIVHIIAVGTRNGLNRRLMVSLVIGCLETTTTTTTTATIKSIMFVCNLATFTTGTTETISTAFAKT